MAALNQSHVNGPWPCGGASVAPADRPYDASMPRLFLAALVALVAWTTGGCSAVAGWERAGSPAAEAGDGTFVAPDAGIRLTLPAGWRLLDPESDTFEQYVDAAADLAGMAPDEFRDALSAMDLYAQGGTSAINVVVIRDDTLPTEAFLREVHDGGQVQLEDFGPVDTPLGPGRRASFHVGTAQRGYHGESAYVVVDGQIAQITVSSFREDDVRPLLDDVLASLQRA